LHLQMNHMITRCRVTPIPMHDSSNYQDGTPHYQ
jgi:hypothetical protein